MSYINGWIEEVNYMRDPRTRAKDRTGPVIFTEYEGDEWAEVVHELPTRWQVCNLCDGEGKHVNPSIDAGGFDPGYWDEDWYDYRSGAYDQTCNQCRGLRVIREVDESKVDPVVLAKYHAHLDDEAEYEAQCLSERMMGA